MKERVRAEDLLVSEGDKRTISKSVRENREDGKNTVWYLVKGFLVDRRAKLEDGESTKGRR